MNKCTPCRTPSTCLLIKRCVLPAKEIAPDTVVAWVTEDPIRRPRFDFEFEEMERDQDRVRLAEALATIGSKIEQIATILRRIDDLERRNAGAMCVDRS